MIDILCAGASAEEERALLQGVGYYFTYLEIGHSKNGPYLLDIK